ncbi:MAG: hypothetical protein KIT48_15810 [Pseudolabrys sp.]|jgi:hypothetical protein|nr:hypothetical protein [Pseudolabrys sp.]
MNVATAKADPRHMLPAANTGKKLSHYVSMVLEVLDEALQQTQEARRKYPFADV